MPGRGNTKENNCARNVGKGIDLKENEEVDGLG